MTIEEYSALLDSVLERFSILKNKYFRNYDDYDISDFLTQLNFINEVVKNKTNFKQALIKQKTEQWRMMLEDTPSDDGVLNDAIRMIYNDLEFHEYNIGRLTQKESEHYYNVISEKNIFYRSDDNIKLSNNEIVSNIFYQQLSSYISYHDLWIENGHRKIQFFVLTKLLNYCSFARNEIAIIPEPFEQELVNDIYRIHQFYMTEEAYGTNMYLDPIEAREEVRTGQPWRIHFYDLKGNLIERSTLS